MKLIFTAFFCLLQANAKVAGVICMVEAGRQAGGGIQGTSSLPSFPAEAERARHATSPPPPLTDDDD